MFLKPGTVEPEDQFYAGQVGRDDDDFVFHVL
jgi:hypothetical protein